MHLRPHLALIILMAGWPAAAQNFPESRPATPPGCEIQLGEQSAIFEGDTYVHTFVGVTIGAGNATTYIEAGPVARNPGSSGPSDTINGNSWLQKLNNSPGKNAYPGRVSTVFDTGFSAENCLQASSLVGDALAFLQQKYTYGFPSPNSNSFSYSILKRSLVDVPIGVQLGLTSPVGPFGFSRAPGWGVLLS